jgi:hypothetical protein
VASNLTAYPDRVGQDCAQSRMWAGVHFRAAVTAGAALGTQIGDSVYTFVDRHIRGAVGPLP